MIRSEKGQMTIGLVVILSFFFVTGGAILGLRLQLRREILHQRRLDQCIQEKVWRLLKIQKSIEFSNLRIEAERVTIQATDLVQPEIAVLARIALAAEVAFQERSLAEWKMHQANWLIHRGCDEKNDLFSPLPSLSWKRPPVDATGPKALRWFGRKENPLPFFLTNGKRTSYAEVYFRTLQWHADWLPWTESL